jgi:SagB-type dehydrogenase family enzyme
MIDTLVGIRPGVRLTTGDQVRAFHPWGVAELGTLRPDTLAALRMLQERVAPSAHLEDLGTELVATLQRVPFLLAHHLTWQGAIELSVTPVARYSDFRPRQPEPGAWLRMSRFVLSRRADRELVMESPLSFQRVVLRSPRLGMLVSLLCRPLHMEDVRAEYADELGPLVEAAVQHLLGTGAIDSAAEEGAFTEDRDEALRQWSFHDLLFHSRSRRGRHDHSYGAVYRFKGEIEPQPAVKVVTGPAVELRKPTTELPSACGVTLDDVLEGRRSIREYGAQPIGVEQLGEFLYRTARIRARFDAQAGVPYETTSRPYPAGGASYELELYPVVARCRGLEPGAYHYDPLGHRLCPLHADESDVARLLLDAGSGMGRRDGPDVLIAITSRFQRVSWKYGSLAYALTLKNVGVLYQTMYLVATAMGLAACALGGGDTDLAAGTLGLDYLREGTVGEFALGSLIQSE